MVGEYHRVLYNMVSVSWCHGSHIVYLYCWPYAARRRFIAWNVIIVQVTTWGPERFYCLQPYPKRARFDDDGKS